MYSINFPSMLSNTRTKLTSDHEATAQNLILLLKSDRTSLFGDPYFGTILKKMLFEQNDLLLQDLVIDELYTTIITFMPQIKLNRNNITLTIDGTAIYANIQCVNLIDYQIDLYTIKLIDSDQ